MTSSRLALLLCRKLEKEEKFMSYKLTICITETLERLIEVEVDDIDCDPIEYVRQQYLDEEIILDANAAWLSFFC